MHKVLEFDESENRFSPKERLVRSSRHLTKQQSRLLERILTDPGTPDELIKDGLAATEIALRTAVCQLNQHLGVDKNRKRYLSFENGAYVCRYGARWVEGDQPGGPRAEFRVLPQPRCIIKQAHLLSFLDCNGGRVNHYPHTLENRERTKLARYGGDSTLIRVKFEHGTGKATKPWWHLMIGFKRDDDGQWHSENLAHFSALKFQARMRSHFGDPTINVRLEDSMPSTKSNTAHRSTDWKKCFIHKSFETITIRFDEWNPNIWAANDGQSIDWSRILRIIIGHDRSHSSCGGTLELRDIRFE